MAGRIKRPKLNSGRGALRTTQKYSRWPYAPVNGSPQSRRAQRPIDRARLYGRHRRKAADDYAGTIPHLCRPDCQLRRPYSGRLSNRAILRLRCHGSRSGPSISCLADSMAALSSAQLRSMDLCVACRLVGQAQQAGRPGAFERTGAAGAAP